MAGSYRQSLETPQGGSSVQLPSPVSCRNYQEAESLATLLRTSSLLTLLLVTLGAFAPALEAVDGGGQEETGHDGNHGYRDAGEDDDEQVCQRQAGLALAEAVLGQLGEGDSPAVHGQGALHALHSCSPKTEKRLDYTDATDTVTPDKNS